ncbi:P-loop containing nucleoside triphosphate hydrolase protein [Aspergillus heterothallicus]
MSRSDTKQENPSNFRGGRAPGPNDVFIAVMDVTGSGKSAFISACSGKAVKIGHHFEACTSHVDVYAYHLSASQTVFLVDTPGFDDTYRSDTDVLCELAGWLGASYQNRILLHGIIYLHRITDIRMQGSAKKNLIMSKQLCGEEALKKVILVTTMWDKVSMNEGVQRETELTNTPEFWGWMMGKGSTCHRHNNTASSARGIVTLLSGHTAPITTELQRQLVDEHKSLEQTSAGRELQSELLKEKERWAREKQEIERQMHQGIKKRDHEAEKMMREERDRYTKMIKKVENDTGALRLTMKNLLADRDKRVEKMERQMKEQQAAHKAELEIINKRQHRIEEEKEKLEKMNHQREKEDERRRKAEKEREEQKQKELEEEKERKAKEQKEKEQGRQSTQSQTNSQSQAWLCSVLLDNGQPRVHEHWPQGDYEVFLDSA